jgi:hypothetical protein
MLSAIILNVLMLSVVAPHNYIVTQCYHCLLWTGNTKGRKYHCTIDLLFD